MLFATSSNPDMKTRCCISKVLPYSRIVAGAFQAFLNGGHRELTDDKSVSRQWFWCGNQDESEAIVFNVPLYSWCSLECQIFSVKTDKALSTSGIVL